MCKTYIEFCHCFSLTPLPASTSCVSCFLVYLSRKTASYQYVMNRHDSVRLLHLHHSFSCDVLNSFPVALTKKGLKRVMSTKSCQKHPITVDLLRRTIPVLDLSISTQVALWCLLLVAFFLFSEKIQSYRSLCSCFWPIQTPHPQRHQVLSQWCSSPNTLQHSESILLIPLLRIPTSDLCPVKAFHHYFQLVSGDVNLRLFTNHLTASPLAFTVSRPKQKHSRTKSRQLSRLIRFSLKTFTRIFSA